MKYTIEGLDQEMMFEMGLDVVDAVLINWLAIFQNSKKMTTLIIDDQIYFWVYFQKVIDDLPLMRIETRQALRRRFLKLEKAGILEFKTERHNKTYFKFADGIIESLQSKSRKKEEASKEVDVHERTSLNSKVQGGGTQSTKGVEPKSSTIDNNTIDSSSSDSVENPSDVSPPDLTEGNGKDEENTAEPAKMSFSDKIAEIERKQIERQIGPNKSVSDWKPKDFVTYHKKLYERLVGATLTRFESDVPAISGLLKKARNNGYVKKVLDYTIDNWDALKQAYGITGANGPTIGIFCSTYFNRFEECYQTRNIPQGKDTRTRGEKRGIGDHQYDLSKITVGG